MKFHKTFFAASLIALTALACGAPNDAPTGSSREAIVPATPTWLGWDSLSGSLASNPVAITTQPYQQVGVFAVAQGEVFQTWNPTSNEWLPADGQWTDLGNNGIKFSSVTAVAVGTTVELFAVSATGAVMHQEGKAPALLAPTWNPGGWEGLGGFSTADAPTVVVSQPGNQINVFTRSPTGTINYLRLWSYGEFSTWSTNEIFTTSAQTPSAPAAVSWGPNRLDVFARGTDNALYHVSSDDNGNTWIPAWENLGGAIGTAPTAVSWGPGRIDLFVGQLGTGALYQKDYNGTAWSPNWLPLNGVAWQDAHGMSVPTAITTGVGSIQVFVQATDRGLYATSLSSLDANGTPSWYPWGNLGSCFAAGGSASVVSRDGDNLDVFVTSAPDGNGLTPVFHDTTNPATVGIAAALPTCPLGELGEPCANESTCNAGLICNDLTCIDRIVP